MKKVVWRSRAEVYELWLKALRSGEYQQTTGRLRKSGPDAGFCCLGVLCDLARKDGGDDWAPAGYYKNRSDRLTSQFKGFMGMSLEMESQLMLQNDSMLDFCRIANYIEEKILPKALRKQ